MPTKSDFNKIFNELRKWGYTVINFSDKRALRRGMKDWVDYVIFNDYWFILVELKIGKDKLSEGQSETADKLSSIMAETKATLQYHIVKELSDAESIADGLIKYPKYSRLSV